jgi:hypothetical protein
MPQNRKLGGIINSLIAFYWMYHVQVVVSFAVIPISNIYVNQVTFKNWLWSKRVYFQHYGPLLAPGGKLLYITCSVFAEENDLQIQQFLATYTDADEIVLTADWGHAQKYGRQILPGENNLDGFYYACLSKKKMP